MGTFVYLDAVVVDTPVVDEAIAEQIDDCAEITERVARSRIFVKYLDAAWDEHFSGEELAFSWDEVKKPIATDYERIERTLAKPRSY